jgi:eukaryotic-like serine/threonine-protein kinase
VETGTLLKRGAFIGRYVVLGRVGGGAMGEVHAAYDPELDRKLAIKLLRVKHEGGEDAVDNRTRLLREAQAMARVSHPNVVAVHDVGSIEDRVFIAMEFIEGSTLTGWLSMSPRSWREVLRVFVAAGRGLHSAHAVDLVHRDFKPDNVMVRKDGQVRVMDFGLVRHVHESSALGQPPGAPAAAASRASDGLVREARAAAPLDDKLTQTGAMMGTPAYMAPEQFQGQPTDARSDQFSFCVALHEALYGQRPFVGADLAQLATHVLHGRPNTPERTRVPASVRRAVRRGLSVNPAARFPSMEELLAELEGHPGTRRRQLWLAVAATVSLVGAAVTVRGAALQHRAMCQAPAQAFEGVWETSGWKRPRRAAIEAAFKETGKDYADAAFASMARVLDRFVGDWSAMYTDACEATNVRGSQSAQVLDLRMGCLADRFGELRALSALFVSPTSDVVENAARAAMALGPLDRCANALLLRGTVAPPAAGPTTTAIQIVRADLAAAKALEDAGKLSAAITALFGVVANARDTGYRPLIAESLYQLGAVFTASGDGVAAEPYLTEAVSEAQASHDDEVVVEAMSGLILVRGYFQRDLPGAELWRRLAEASLDRIGGDDRLRARALANWAAALEAARRFDEALKVYADALSYAQRALGPSHFEAGLTMSRISALYSKLGQFQEALAYNDRALAISEGALGRNHPDLAAVLSNRADIMAGLGRFFESKIYAERDYELLSRNLGSPDHPLLAGPLGAIGIAELGLGHPQRAVAPLTRALSLAEKGHIPLSLADMQFALARALFAAHRDRSGALAQARAALTEVSTVGGATPRDRALRAAIEQWQARTAAPASGPPAETETVAEPPRQAKL